MTIGENVVEGRNSVPLGAFIVGYLAWLMYKGKNSEILGVTNVLLVVVGIVFLLIFISYITEDSEGFESIVGVDTGLILIELFVSFCLYLGLRVYIKKQLFVASEAVTSKKVLKNDVDASRLTHIGKQNHVASRKKEKTKLDIAPKIQASKMTNKNQEIENRTDEEKSKVKPDKSINQNSDTECVTELSLYEKALDELESNSRHKGIWAKAYSDAENEESAKRLYVKYRASFLIDEAESLRIASQEKVREQDRKETLQIEELKSMLATRSANLVQNESGFEVLGPDGEAISPHSFQTIGEVAQWASIYSPDDINTYNDRGYTKLIEAAIAGDFEEVKLLITLGADPSVKDRDSQAFNALSFASRERLESDLHSEIYKFLYTVML